MNGQNLPWWVVLLVVYGHNYDAPWCQITAGGLSQTQAQAHVTDLEEITAATAKAPVHQRHGGQTDRFIIMVPARNGLMAIQRAILVLNDARSRDMQDALRVEALSEPTPLDEDQ